MKGTMVIIPVSGPETRTEHTEPVDSQALHDAVGGFIELVPYFEEYETPDGAVFCIAFCNENGKQERLQYNDRANRMWTRIMVTKYGRAPYPDYLVGNVVILFGDEKFMESL